MLRRFLLAIAATILVGIASTWFWLLHTESGMQRIIQTAQQTIPGELSVSAVSGDLSNGATVQGLTLTMDGVSASAADIQITLDIDLLPLSVEITTLHVSSVLVELFAGEEPDQTQTTDITTLLEGLALPVRLLVTDLLVKDATLIGLTGERPIEISTLELVGQWKDTIQVDRLHVDERTGTADVVAAFELHRPFALDLSSQLTFALADIPQLTGANIAANGDLHSTLISVDTQGIEARLQGQLGNLLSSPSWDLTAEVPGYNQALDEEQELQIDDLAIASIGDIDGYEVNAVLVAATTSFEAVSIRLAGAGTLESIDLSTIEIDGEDVALSATGGAKWSEPRRATATIQLDRFNPAALLQGWPSPEQVTGELSMLLTNDRLLVEDAALSLIDRSASVRLNANINLTSNVVEGDLHWTDIQWPIAEPAPQIASEQGSILLSGTFDDWRVSGTTTIQAADFARGQFMVEGGGDRKGLALQILEGNVLGGDIQGRIEYSWIDEQAFAGALGLKNVSIGTLLPQWPGVISGGVTAAGQLSPLQVRASLEEIDGNLRGKPLAANGTIDIDGGELAAENLRVVHGESSLSLHGSLYAQQGFTFDAQLDNLGDYLDDSYGSVSATGQLSLAADKPFLRIDAASDEIGYRDYRLTGVQIVDRQSTDHLIDVEVSAASLLGLGQNLTDLRLQTSVTRDEQIIALALRSGDLEANVAVRGAFENWDMPSESPWSGVLDELIIAIDERGQISLTSPSPLRLSTQSSSVERFCVGHDAETHFCAEASWAAGGTTNAHIDLTDIPVGLVNLFTDIGIEFDQLISGTIDWSQAAGTGATGGANVRLTSGVIRDTKGSGVVVNTDPGSIEFDVRDGNLLAGTINLPMPGSGKIEGEFSVIDVSLGTESSIEGSLDIAFNDIGIAAALSPLVDDASGALSAQMSLRGTVADPVLTGQFAAVDARLTYLPLGLRLDDIDLNGNVNADKSIELEGHFVAGEGRANISTRADYADTSATGLEVVLRGKNLTIIDVPDVRAVSDIDLQINFDGKKLVLGGTVFVPRALIAPQNLTASRTSESDDVVIVAGSLPDDDVHEKESRIEILGELEIGLGDDIVIDLDLAQAEVAGSAMFTWSGDPMPIVNGRYDMSGEIQAFGQVLSITEGMIRFPNVPANNPFIRVRAEREIYGNSQIKRAGVLVAGSAQRQTIEPYSYPLTTEERALTLLITGSDFDYEQGVGAVDFGTYIAPKLFVSYGIGLFDKENVISARYDLKKGFGVKATSGDKSSGVDFSYRIER